MPDTFYLFAEEIPVSVHVDEKAVFAVFCTNGEIVVLFWFELLTTSDLEHTQVVPVEEEFFDARCAIPHRIVGADSPMVVRRELYRNFRHPHEAERFGEVGAHARGKHPMVVGCPLVLQEVLCFVERAGGHLAINKAVAREIVRSVFHAEDHAMSGKVGACQREARFEDTAFVDFLSFVDALMTLKAVVEIAVQT